MKEPVVKGVSVLRIPFGTPCTGPKKRFVKDLEEVAYQSDICRNAMLRHWVRWHEDHPDYQPKQKIDEEGQPRKNKKGEPMMEDPLFPYCLDSSTCEESLYRKGQRVAPILAAKIISTIQKEVVKKLKARMPYNHKGKAKTKGKAILLSEINAENNKARIILVPNQDTILAYDGFFSNKAEATADLTKNTKRKTPGVEIFGKSSCVLQFPLFSKESGRKFKSVISNLDISKFTPGQKAVIKRVCKGEWKLHDSTVLHLPHKRGNKWEPGWYFNLTYTQPRKELNLNKDNTATLFANPMTKDRAFVISASDESWQIGNRFYQAEINRLANRRKSLRNRYKAGAGAGHGKGNFYNALRPYSRATTDAQSRFQWLAIKDIINFCIRNNCGTLLYREPSLGIRNYNTWFCKQGLPFAWDKFCQKLVHKCHIHGIEFVVERVRKAEYDTIFPPQERNGKNHNGNGSQPNGASTLKTQGVTDTHVKSLKFVKGRGKRGHQAAPLATGKAKRTITRS